MQRRAIDDSMGEQNDIVGNTHFAQAIDIIEAVHKKPGATSQCLSDLLRRSKLRVGFQAARPVKYDVGVYAGTGHFDQRVREIAEIKKTEIVLQEDGVELIPNEIISDTRKPASILSPQPEDIIGIGSDRLLVIGEDRDLVGVLIKMFEEVFGMRGYPATRIIGRDPTQTKLSGHHWPFMKVFNKPLYPRCDLAPSE